jgi:hypothetical protein
MSMLAVVDYTYAMEVDMILEKLRTEIASGEVL